MKLYAKIENPAVIGGKGETLLNLELDEDTGDVSGKFAEFADSVRRVANRYNDVGDLSVLDELMEKAIEERLTLSEAIQILRESPEGFAYATNDNGDLVVGEALRDIIASSGYDGIIDRTVNRKFGSERRYGKMIGMTPSTIHVIAFRPEQVKSATGNRGTFDPKDPDIRNPYTKPDLRERLKAKIMAGSKGGNPGQWSARKAQLLAAEYEKAGGGYTGARSKAQRSLSKWTKQDWRTKSGKPSLETGERYLPAAAIKALSSAEYAASTKAKRSATGQFSRQPKRIAMKTREFRNPLTYPQDQVSGGHTGPANSDINAAKVLWDTPAFKKWFGDSKVRDAVRRPMVVYHGTCASGFTKFDPTKTREMGFHFGTLPQARDFLKGCGEYRGKSPGIYPVYLSIQNPLFTPDAYSEDPIYFIQWLEKSNHIHEWFPDEDDSYYRSMNRLRDQMATIKADPTLTGGDQYKALSPLRKATWGLLRKVVIRKGYDGIRYRNDNEGHTGEASNIAWIAFSPAQVKSATENRGTFNRRDPDLRNPRRSMIRTKLSRIIEPGDRVLDYDRAQGEDLYRLWDMVHTDMPLNEEALTEIEGLLDDDGVLVIQSGEEPAGLRKHFRRATRYQGMLLVQGPLNPEEARINTEKLRRDLE